MEALILVATSGGPMMFARIGIMRGSAHLLNWHILTRENKEPVSLALRKFDLV